MKRKNRNTSLAFLIFLLVASAAYLWDKKKQEEKEAEEDLKLWTLEEDQIQSVQLSPRVGESIRCQRNGEKWKIVAPLELPADSFAISGLLTSLGDLPADEVIDPEPTSLEEYGLETPEESLEASDGSKNFVLHIGSQTPTGDGYYIRTGDNSQVLKMPSHLKSSLTKSLFDLRDRKVLALDRAKITKVRISSPPGELNFEKSPDGDWQVVLPPAVRTDKFAVQSLVNSIESAEMQSVVEESARQRARYGLVKPSTRVLLTQGNEIQELWIGKKSEENRYYAMRRGAGPVFTVFDTFVNQLKKPVKDFRNGALFDFASFDAKRLEIHTSDNQWVLEKKEDEWKKVSAENGVLDRAKVDKLLADLRNVRAEEFVTDRPGSTARYGLDSPEVSVRVAWGDGKQESVSITQMAEKAYARRAETTTICEVKPSSLEEIKKALSEL